MNVAVIAAHPDDAELAMGGTIALLVSQGHRVIVIDATDGEPTPHGDPVTRAREAVAAAAELITAATAPACSAWGQKQPPSTWVPGNPTNSVPRPTRRESQLIPLTSPLGKPSGSSRPTSRRIGWSSWVMAPDG